MAEDLSHQIRDWLSKPETGALLDAAARSVLKAVRERKLSPLFLKQGIRPDAPPNELLPDIRSEIVLFILENRRRIQERLASSGKMAGLELKNAFILYWLDKTRNPGSDPRRYLYKRVLDTLRKAKGFFIRSSRGSATVFSMANEGITIPGLSDEDLALVPLPEEIVGGAPSEALKRESTLIKLARYFWERVRDMWDGKPVWVSLADFTGWIGRWAAVDLPAAAGVDIDLAASPDLQAGAVGQSFDPEKIREWAEDFAGRLSGKEKAVFYLHQGSGLTLEAIAGRLGYGGPSGPHYQLDQVQAKLRFFLRDLPWMSPDDLNEEAFSLFLDTLLSILKQAAAEP